MVIFAMLIGRALESASAPALARPPFSATRIAHSGDGGGEGGGRQGGGDGEGGGLDGPGIGGGD